VSPIVERDPWRMRYFERVDCPADLFIPTEDSDAWALYPRERWVYDKLRLCESQGLDAAPHGVWPRRWPVFSKPICNLRGMGAGTAVLSSPADYERALAPGHMWMPLLEGRHVSSDVALVEGQPRWWRHAVGAGAGGGTFDHWTVLAEPDPQVAAPVGTWLRGHLRGHTGIVNLETIGGTIIDCHLRLSDQWVDLYGAGWLESVVALYAHGRWALEERARRTGYSVVLFGPHGRTWQAPDDDLVAALERRPSISSIQITFHRDRPPAAHSMPPGGFRLAVINGWDLDAGRAVREALASALGVERATPASGTRGATSARSAAPTGRAARRP
jgi:hypothetical protein